MKPKKLFSILFPTYFLISLLGIVVLLLITRFAFRNIYYKQSATSLIQHAKLIERDVISNIETNNITKLKSEIKYLAKQSDSRITVILPDGNVIADSSFETNKMENHLNRVEISTAIGGEIGESIRLSPTLNKNLLYVAIPLVKNNKVLGVLRNAVSTDKLQNSLYQLSKNIILWSLILLLVLTYIIYLQSKSISAPLEKLKNQVEILASGNFSENIELTKTSNEEVYALSVAIQKMGKDINQQFNKINKQKNEQLAVFSSMLEGVITIYPDSNIYHINKSALNIFNFKKNGPIKGTPLKEVVKSERIYQLALKLLENHLTVDHEFEYDSGRVLNVHGTILESEKTGMLGAVLVFNDITKMRELENYRKQFVANVSHELKTPLTSIQGYLETIREEKDLDQKTLYKFIDIINKHSMRLKNIIEDLLHLSSIEKDSEIGELNLVKQNLLPVIKNAISLCIEKAKTKRINIALSAIDEEININAPLLEQAIINLLDNAIKYGPENSEVQINISKTENFMKIIVSDQGQGIPKIHHDRLFERFYSVDKARSRELGGSGLGLSIVKHIALAHGGNISVKSEVNSGSSFILEIPV